MASIFEFFKRGLQKTKTSLMRKISGIFGGEKAWDQDTYDELEAALVSTDLGVVISGKLVAEVKDRYERGQIKTGEDIMAVAQESILKLLSENGQPEINHAANGPTVIMMVGVNGSGKTTSVAKLAHYFMKQGKSVLLGAGDTFRAAGVEQLKIWGDRLGVPVVGGKQGGEIIDRVDMVSADDVCELLPIADVRHLGGAAFEQFTLGLGARDVTRDDVPFGMGMAKQHSQFGTDLSGGTDHQNIFHLQFSIKAYKNTLFLSKFVRMKLKL